MQRFIYVLLCGCLLALTAHAQVQQEPREPATKLEAFQTRSGIVVIRGFTNVGTVNSNSGSIEVDARELRDARNPKTVQTGIAITVKESGRLQRENISFIDVDEVDSLLSGIEYISKATKEVTKHQHFEAVYRTKGDLRITVFNSTRGDLSASVESGRVGRTNVFLSMDQLSKLKELIEGAKGKL
jgi:hypothetical protein